MTGTSWMQHAACATEPMALFFAADGEPPEARAAREAEAKAICSGCPVRVRCLTYRLTQPRQLDDCVWGGMDGDERNAELRRQRRRARRTAEAA